MSSSSLEDLAASITEQVSKLSSLHKELGLPARTLEKSGSRDYATEADTPEGEALRETRSRILNAAADLVRLVQGPTDHILNLTWSVSFLMLRG
jgi:6-hydroxytryprostatin B O-methyltransferase